MRSRRVTLQCTSTKPAVMETVISDIQPIRVLLVEDEFLISEWVAESLSEQGFAVSTASNAAEALRHLASAPVDVLFTDINLPGGMDGVVLARRARELLPELPVVYASGRVNMLDAQLCVPGSIFVAKPYAPALVGPLLTDALKATTGRNANRYCSTAPRARNSSSQWM
jgi:CheY-like chemotaxis protein